VPKATDGYKSPRGDSTTINQYDDYRIPMILYGMSLPPFRAHFHAINDFGRRRDDSVTVWGILLCVFGYSVVAFCALA